MQEKGESLMGKDRICRPGATIPPIPGDECVLFAFSVLFVSLAVWGLALSSKNKTPRDLLPFLQNFDLREVLRHHLFPALTGHRFLPG
ncbi:hypothetical protein AVEN_232714-1 [Araneus ventricosus]|uniref:Uncharacterized protein n=1 Tax=Araneus ventricosus TaxID=182803 RepID=A0A4Y2KQV4_ARAVE|nr:hypothetical protein AVEN_232714-1 [Araneus ventricosus]